MKYRGIFLNDEAPALTGWAKEKFGGVNHKFYEKVFELILRLKGNYLWPAMWGNAFNDDDNVDPQLADDYGIVMGTSHHEPMLRAQQEWKRYGKGPWNYEHNDSTLRAFWADGIRNMGPHENIVTVGMRGDGDMPMTTGSNIALLERIVRDQRAIIETVTKKPASETPQLWALYKEVQDYYDKGMRVPDDVTLLFSDDNWGNIRRLPSRADTARAGGFGIYYHFDYVGGPRNYKWINTNPIARVWEQMHLAYEYGARRIWIVNVGDLKPMEFPISFFLDYAWNPNRIPAGEPSGVHAPMGRAAVRLGAIDGDRRDHLEDAELRRPAQARAARHAHLQPDELSRGGARRRVVRLAAFRGDENRSQVAAERARRVLRARAAPDRGRGEPEQAVRHGREESHVRGAGARGDERSRRQRAPGCSTRTPRSPATTTRSWPAGSGTT